MAISISFSFSWASQPGAREASFSGCCFLYSIIFLLSDAQTDWISCALSYIIVQRTLNLFPLLAIGICTSSVFGMACLTVIERKYLSCSSQVTLFRCISLWLYRGILTLSHIVSKARPRQWNMHFRCLCNGMFGRVWGQYTIHSWQWSATSCKDVIIQSHRLWILNFVTSTIFSWSLTRGLPFCHTTGLVFLMPRIFCPKKPKKLHTDICKYENLYSFIEQA